MVSLSKGNVGSLPVPVLNVSPHMGSIYLDHQVLATAPQSGNSGTAFSYETPDASSGETKQPDGEDDLEEASCTHDES